MPPIVIGNDIISLSSLPNYDENRRHRYARKIMVDSEYEVWQQNGASEIDLFKYWALKEAAYKIRNRETRERVFNPKCFVVGDLGNNEEVTVQSPEAQYTGSITVTEDYIYCVLVDTTSVQLEDVQSSIQRSTLNRPSQIVKKDGMPFLSKQGKLIPISMSHCENWYAHTSPMIQT